MMSVILASWKPVRPKTLRASWISTRRVRSERFVRLGPASTATGGAMRCRVAATHSAPLGGPPRLPQRAEQAQCPYVSDPDVAVNLPASFRAGAAGSAKVGVRREVHVTEPTTMASVAAEVRDWLAANWEPDRSLAEWRELLVDSGWGCPTWPKEWYGRGLPAAAEDVVDAEFRRVGAVGPADRQRHGPGGARRSSSTAPTT